MADRKAHPSYHLNDEIGRIASTLADLSSKLSAAVSPSMAQQADELPINEETVRSAIRHRRLRELYFASELFADPAWDMMLELLLAEIMQQRVTVSNLCDVAGVPPTTALRWQKALVDRGLLVRNSDPDDARRVYVELASETSIGLRRYFAQVQSAANRGVGG